MNKNLILALAAVVLLALTGAKPIDRNVVEVGTKYLISNGTAAITGTIVADLGNGWYSVKRQQDGAILSVNVGLVFFVQELKK